MESPVCNSISNYHESQWKKPVFHRHIGYAAAASSGIEFGSPSFYAVCVLGGALACSSTHIVTLPIDIIKVRMQADHKKYPTMLEALKITLREDGVKGLARGWGATLAGYGGQGIVRFSLYEYFKIKFANWAGPETFYNYRTPIYLVAAACAEIVADIPLSPFEGIKVRTQTNPNFPQKLREAFPLVWTKEGMGGMFQTLVPLWGRQIPYTMVKFATFERTLEFLYKNVVGKPRDLMTISEQLLVTFAAGYSAGVACAIASHPMDTMVSKFSGSKKGTSFKGVYQQIGFWGLWKGLGPRILMIGSVAASQWLIYDAIKVSFNVPRPPPPVKPPSLK